MTFGKNIELSDWRNERQADYRTICSWGFYTQRKLDHISTYFWCKNLSWYGYVKHVKPTPVDFWLIYKNQLHYNALLILKILKFNESLTIWSIKSIYGDNSRPKILLDMEIWMGILDCGHFC